MLCISCAKLLFLGLKKQCIQCHGEIVVNLFVICETCSATKKQCSVCLKKIQPVNTRSKGCGCGKK